MFIRSSKWGPQGSAAARERASGLRESAAFMADISKGKILEVFLQTGKDTITQFMNLNVNAKAPKQAA